MCAEQKMFCTHFFHISINVFSHFFRIMQKENGKAWKEKGYKMKKWKKMGKRFASVMVCVLLVFAMGSNAGVHMIKADTKERDDRKENENSFTEEGTTSMGTISQMPEFSLNRALMYVEEVYVEAGNTVVEGDALFKIAEESMEDATAYYENAVAMAEDALEDAQVAYESGKLDASYVKLDAQTKAANAEITLENALTELEEDVQTKYKKWQDTAYAIAAYHDNFYNNLYYKNAGVDEKTAAVATAQQAYEAAGVTYEAANTALEEAMQVLVRVNNGETVEGMTLETAATAVAEAYSVLETVEPLYEALEQANRELQQAQQTYEKDTEQAEKVLEQLENNVDALQQNYESANREAETKKLELQNEYELSVLEGEYAQTVYDETVEALEEAVESAEKTLEDLQEEQAALLALEDGVVCATQSGTLASVTYGEDDVLFSGTAFVTYYETSVLTISVEVEQENIAKVAVGDEVSVSVSGNRRGNITGTVASIATTATTGRSVSDVTYAVVISIENENNMLSAGTSATVTFEYGE